MECFQLYGGLPSPHPHSPLSSSSTPPPSGRPLLRALQGKINIFRNGCAGLLPRPPVSSPFFLAMGNSYSPPLSHCSCTRLAVGSLPPPMKKKKAAPRKKVSMATALTGATPQKQPCDRRVAAAAWTRRSGRKVSTSMIQWTSCFSPEKDEMGRAPLFSCPAPP